MGRGLPQKVGAGLVQGMSQALEECEGPARMKEGRRDGVRFIAAGVAMQPRQEAGRGRTEAAAASQTQLGAAGSVTPLGGVGWRAPPGGEAGNREAALLAERRGRREAPDGLLAPPAGCGGSRSQSGARAQTSGRQRTPASGPQGPRGGGGERGAPVGVARGVAWRARSRPAGRRATWAAPPLGLCGGLWPGTSCRVPSCSLSWERIGNWARGIREREAGGFFCKGAAWRVEKSQES